MYIFDGMLMLIEGQHTKETFNFWTAKNCIRLSLAAKPKLGDALTIGGLDRQHKVIGFSYHKPSEYEPVIDIVKLKLLV